METTINGLHHITAMAADPQANYDFYSQVLGLRLVKKTVNFDVPDVYHFYFADEVGSPGTVLTFFPFPNAARGSRGAGEADVVGFSVPQGSLDFWRDRLATLKAENLQDGMSFGEPVLTFDDPDGMRLELHEDDVGHLRGWETPEVPRIHSIRKFHSTRVLLNDDAATRNLILNHLGLHVEKVDGNATRYTSGAGDHLAYLDVVVDPKAPRARQSAGSVHHIAWRTQDDENQLAWRDRLETAGYHVTDVIDRNYFHSIYFREPGGVLFEIATDNPGFTDDEDLGDLGSALKLPPQYEGVRDKIEQRLIPLRT